MPLVLYLTHYKYNIRMIIGADDVYEIIIAYFPDASAQVTTGAVEDADDDAAINSTLRKQSVGLLADEDSKYAGKTV